MVGGELMFPICLASVSSAIPARRHQLIVEGIALHIAGLIEDGLRVPDAISYAELVTISAA